MALPAETSAPPLSPQVVGNAFVEQYYHVLYHSPESVYKFYKESSNFSRPNSHGVMTSATTMQAINDMVLSFDYKNYIAEIMTVDSQPSDSDGVFILVTGCLTGQDKIRRKFTQSFFLAPQDKGVYFVQNDIFRFVDGTQTEDLNQMPVNISNDEGLKAPVVPENDSVSEQDHNVTDPATPPSEGVLDDGTEACNPSENGDPVVEKEIVVDPQVHPIDTQPVSEAKSTVPQVDVPKKSYASIVKVTKGCTSPSQVYMPTSKTRPSPVNPKKPMPASTMPASAPASAPSQASPAPAPTPETPAASSNDVSDKSNSLDVEEGHSIYIRNLPFSITDEQVKEEFKKFGPIKPEGVQVRSHKIESFCFGFVEFESLDSMQAAIEASPIMIGGRRAFIEAKKTTTRVVNGVATGGNYGGGRGRYPPGRGGFQNGNFRERGGFVGNQGFGRSDFRNQGDYSGRGWGPPSRAGEGYRPRVFQNGYNGRMGRPTEMKQATIAA